MGLVDKTPNKGNKMIRANIYRSHEQANVWVVVVTDTVREKREASQFEMLSEAEGHAKSQGATKVNVSMGEASVPV